METTLPHTYKGYVDLDNRRLWCDGSISVNPKDVSTFMLKHKSAKIFTKSISNEIIEYNRLVDKSEQITKKQDLELDDIEWVIPIQYKTLDITDFIFEKLFQQETNLSDEENMIRINRIQYELKKFKEYDLIGLLRTLIYIVDEFTANNIVWGVGRGSSVSSYILYLIGIHDIDSVEYELDFDEFLHG